ncbi:MAG TPA: MOSC domain-containing protein [Anaerolineales bacterium]|nr:MOSC domain-containing protein [Anaerolineales bacterium]
MKLISVNIGKEQAIHNGKPSGKTGIHKQPVDGPVMLSRLGISEDSVCDKKHHGGPDQAVYLYGEPDYAWWSGQLGDRLSPGTFGDNLTVEGLESARLQIGDSLRIGAAVLQVTAPRIPCGTLAARMGDPQFVKRFRAAERPGVYCRVLQEGIVQAGDPVTLERFSGETISVLDMFRDFYDPDMDENALRRYLAAPIAGRARVDKEEQLQKLLAQ